MARKSMIEAIAALSNSAGRMGGEPQTVHRGLDEMAAMLIAGYVLAAHISATRLFVRERRGAEDFPTLTPRLKATREWLIGLLSDTQAAGSGGARLFQRAGGGRRPRRRIPAPAQSGAGVDRGGRGLSRARCRARRRARRGECAHRSDEGARRCKYASPAAQKIDDAGKIIAGMAARGEQRVELRRLRADRRRRRRRSAPPPAPAAGPSASARRRSPACNPCWRAKVGTGPGTGQ